MIGDQFCLAFAVADSASLASEEVVADEHDENGGCTERRLVQRTGLAIDADRRRPTQTEETSRTPP